MNVDTHPYLGIELKSNIQQEADYDKITSKTNSVLFMLMRALKHSDAKTQKIAYFSLVRPKQAILLLYNGDPFSKQKIKKGYDKVQNTSLTFIFKLKDQVRENTGIENLAKMRKDLRFKYYLKAIEKNNQLYTLHNDTKTGH